MIRNNNDAAKYYNNICINIYCAIIYCSTNRFYIFIIISYIAYTSTLS